MRLYSSRIEKAQIVFEEGVFKAKFEFSEEADGLNGKWVRLNTPLEA